MDAWSPEQLKRMQLGGNDALNAFLKNYGVDKYTDIRDKYNSQGAEVSKLPTWPLASACIGCARSWQAVTRCFWPASCGQSPQCCCSRLQLTCCSCVLLHSQTEHTCVLLDSADRVHAACSFIETKSGQNWREGRMFLQLLRQPTASQPAAPAGLHQGLVHAMLEQQASAAMTPGTTGGEPSPQLLRCLLASSLWQHPFPAACTIVDSCCLLARGVDQGTKCPAVARAIVHAKPRHETASEHRSLLGNNCVQPLGSVWCMLCARGDKHVLSVLAGLAWRQGKGRR